MKTSASDNITDTDYSEMYAEKKDIINTYYNTEEPS